jgi:hypothetical protein
MTDPVAAALERRAADLPESERARFVALMREGLATFDPVLELEDKVVEIEAALDVPPGQRLAAAERFAAGRRAFVLGRRSWELLGAFARGADVRAQAEQLLAEILAAIDAEAHDDVRTDLGDYATECRYILSRGTGPNSLRGAKAVSR